MFETLQKTDKRIHRVNMRLTDKQMKFIKAYNLSPTKIMDNAINNLIVTNKLNNLIKNEKEV